MINVPFDEFLRPLFDPTDTVCLRVFDDRRTANTFKGLKLESETAKLSNLADTLHKHNSQMRGVYFVVNHGGHEDVNINRINAVFVENDNLPIPEQITRLEAFALPPSMMVKTAKSVHAYWLVSDVKVEDFRTMQKRLVAQFDGDPSCVNESRVMRLPGFYHCKGGPVMVECIKFAPELRYTKAQLDAVLPNLSDAGHNGNSGRGVNTATRKGLSLVTERCQFIQHCRDNAATLPENLWYAMITNLAVFDDGSKAIHELSKSHPKYSRAETSNKITHFIDSSTKPMTCAKIAELGWTCPNLNDGRQFPACGCRSPAALAFKPLQTEELLIVLNTFDFSGSPLEKIKIIKEFITEYLYNIEPIIAETLLNHDIKSRAGLKASEVSPLVKLHREMHKKYTQNKEMRREENDLPDWYEMTERGIKFLPAVLAEHMAKEVRAFYSAEQYYIYQDGVYNAISDLEARRMARSFMIPRYTLMSNITDAEGQWRMLCMKPLREINANPYIVNVRNGLYNVIDGSFAAHDPSYLSTVQLTVNYVPSAKCPRFMQFLAESLGEEEIPLVQEMLGYFLIPVNKAQKSFVIVGEPGAGKSKLLLTLNEILLGQQNVSNIPWQSLNERFKTAELFGKLANIFADLPTKNIDDNGIFKALVGEDFLTAERKNKDPFTFQPHARLLFSCNAIPRNYGDKSEGFYRRLIIIRFSKPVPEEKRDAELLDKFAAEADGIFLFAVEGLRRLIANKYKFSETAATRAEVQRYRVDSNSVLSFVEECCQIEQDVEIERGELFARYREYCQTAGLSPVSQKTFNKDFELGYPCVKRSVDRLGKRRTWRGIRIECDPLP